MKLSLTAKMKEKAVQKGFRFIEDGAEKYRRESIISKYGLDRLFLVSTPKEADNLGHSPFACPQAAPDA